MSVKKYEEIENTTPTQQRTRRGKLLATFRCKINESIVYMLTSDILRGEQYLRYNPDTNCFNEPGEPAWEIYKNEIFGIRDTGKSKTDSLLYSISKALLVGKDHPIIRARELLQFMQGQGNSFDFSAFVQDCLRHTHAKHL